MVKLLKLNELEKNGNMAYVQMIISGVKHLQVFTIQMARSDALVTGQNGCELKWATFIASQRSRIRLNLHVDFSFGV